MATEIQTRTRTVYKIDDEEYNSLRLLRRAHKELVFSNKADDETLALIGITREEVEYQIEVTIPDEEEEDTASEGEDTSSGSGEAVDG